ncbi:MAG: hypothetical protein WBF06_16065 [Candidatus Acidiferrales bacterium]
MRDARDVRNFDMDSGTASEAKYDHSFFLVQGAGLESALAAHRDICPDRDECRSILNFRSNAIRADRLQPGNRVERICENIPIASAMKPAQNRHLARVANALSQARASETSAFVKHDGATRAAPSQNGGGSQHAERKAAARPTKRRVLQQDPLPLPIGAVSPKALQSTEPSVVVPREVQPRERDATPRECVAQKFAIVIDAVGCGIEPSHKRNHGMVKAAGQQILILTPGNGLSR